MGSIPIGTIKIFDIMSRLNLNSNKCPTCNKKLSSSRGVRQHHSKVHNKELPNRKCDICGDEFYDDQSMRDHCDECKKYSKYSDIPDDLDISIEEWVDMSKNERHYLRHKQEENKRVAENKKNRVKWVRGKFLLDAECNRCGFDDSRAIEFHHTENNKMDESPLQMARNMRSKETIADEIERGELICANCHMIEHQTERFK